MCTWDEKHSQHFGHNNFLLNDPSLSKRWSLMHSNVLLHITLVYIFDLLSSILFLFLCTALSNSASTTAMRSSSSCSLSSPWGRSRRSTRLRGLQWVFLPAGWREQQAMFYEYLYFPANTTFSSPACFPPLPVGDGEVLWQQNRLRHDRGEAQRHHLHSGARDPLSCLYSVLSRLSM